MAALSTTFCTKIREARRKAGLTQAALAKTVGCAQSAISMLEGGRADAVAMETIGKILEALHLELPETSAADTSAPPPSSGFAAARPVKICPNAECPSNFPYRVGRQVMFLPTAHRVDGGRCPVCGEVLESACPDCGRPVQPGHAFCTDCGHQFVAVPDGMSPPDNDWIAAQQALAEKLNGRSRQGG